MKSVKRAPQKVAKLKIVKNDPWLEPYNDAIQGRHDYVLSKIDELTGGKQSLSDFADGHLYFGLHRTPRQWVLREWAPNATAIYLIGDFNDWQENEKFKFEPIGSSGNWELKLPSSAMKHLDLYKLKIYWQGGCGERIPAWCRRVVQDEDTKIFSAQVWYPESPYEFKKKKF